MAIFNMEDSSINEYINENRSMKQAINQGKKHGVVVDKDSGSKEYKNMKNYLDEGRDKAKNLSTSDLQLMRKMNIKANSQAGQKRREKLAKSRSEVDDNIAKSYAYLANKYSKKIYGRTYGAELKKRGYDPKTGEKLREAAEYILSILDEMDYIEEGQIADLKK